MVEQTRRRDGDLLQPSLFLVSDLLALEAAFLLTYFVRFLTGWLPTPLGVPPFLPYLNTSLVLLVVWAGIFYTQGLYDPLRRKSLEEDFVGLFRSVVLGSLVVLAMAFFVRGVSYSRTFFVLFFATSLFFLFSGRVLVRAFLRRSLRRGVGVTRVLLVGESPMRDRLVESFQRLPGLGFELVGGIQIDPTAPIEDGRPIELDGLPVVGGPTDLEQVVRDRRVDSVLLTLPFERLAVVTDVAERLGPLHVDVQFVPDMERIQASRMRLKEIAGMPFISVREGGLSGIDRILKQHA